MVVCWATTCIQDCIVNSAIRTLLSFSPSQTAGGIFLPDSKLGKTNEGEVIAVGPGRVTETGTKIAVNVTVGDTVLLPEYGGTTLTLGDEELSLFRDEDILGKFQVRFAVAGSIKLQESFQVVYAGGHKSQP